MFSFFIFSQEFLKKIKKKFSNFSNVANKKKLMFDATKQYSDTIFLTHTKKKEHIYIDIDVILSVYIKEKCRCSNRGTLRFGIWVLYDQKHRKIKHIVIAFFKKLSFHISERATGKQYLKLLQKELACVNK